MNLCPKENDKHGYVVLAGIEDDNLATTTEVEKMADLLKEKANIVTILRNKIEMSLTRKGLKDPHLAKLLRNPQLQADIIGVMF